MILVDWEKLARIRELQEHFESDFSGFKQCIHNYVQNLQKLTSPDLDKLAVLRVLEVTNGCAQWGFRRQDDQCLSTDQTRECMKKVMGFIKQGRITLPNGESIELVPSARQLFDQGRQLYQDAFKRNIATAEREYYAYSTAQFLVYGHQRLHNAMGFVQQHYEPLFGRYYIQKGRQYIAPYIDAFPSSEAEGIGNDPGEPR